MNSLGVFRNEHATTSLLVTAVKKSVTDWDSLCGHE